MAGTKIHADSSLVDANASLNSVRELDAGTLDRSNERAVNKLKSSTKQRPIRTRRMTIKTQICPHQVRGQKSIRSIKVAPTQKPPGSSAWIKTRPRYKNHRAVDNVHGVITAVRTTTGRINESHELTELIDQHQTNTKIAAKTIVADCKYGTIENYIACQERKLRTHMADLLASSPGSGRRDGIYPESMFCYKPESDIFLCPAGQLLKPRRLHSVRLSWEYVTKRGVCLSCRLREFCTRSKTGRSIKRHRNQNLLDRARRQANTKRPSSIGNADNI